MQHQCIIQKLEEKLGSDDFISPKDLVQSGIFGSSTAVQSALKKKLLPYIKVTSHRCLIPRDSVIEYLKKHLTTPVTEHGGDL